MSKKNKENKEGELDLNDPEVCKMLHSNSEIKKTAAIAGAGSGLIGGLIAGMQSVFVMPDYKKKFQKYKPEEKFLTRLKGVSKENKLLTGLVAAPAIAAVGSGTYAFFKTKSMLNKKKHELEVIEQKQQDTGTDFSDHNEPATNNTVHAQALLNQRSKQTPLSIG